jgi:hypothetical protein
LFRIDVAGLRNAGVNIPSVQGVTRNFGMPGGGQEMRFTDFIAPNFLTRIRWWPSKSFVVASTSSEDVSTRAIKAKDSNSVPEQLLELYLDLTVIERESADWVICEWAISPDAATRFDGQALIDRIGLIAAIPALERAEDNLSHSTEAMARYELQRVHRLIMELRCEQQVGDR